MASQLMYIVLIVAALLIGYKMKMLPNQITYFIDMFMPMSPIINTPPIVPGITAKCEDFTTNTQCGLLPNACEWMDNKCRSRTLTPAEQGK